MNRELIYVLMFLVLLNLGVSLFNAQRVHRALRIRQDTNVASVEVNTGPRLNHRDSDMNLNRMNME